MQVVRGMLFCRPPATNCNNGRPPLLWENQAVWRNLYYGACGRHFATMRVDRSAVVPGEWWVAQAEVPTPPYIAGLITYTVKINGHKIKLTLGEIGTREKDDGSATQYYGQFVSIPPKECKFLRIELDDA